MDKPAGMIASKSKSPIIHKAPTQRMLMSASLLADRNTSELAVTAYTPGCLLLAQGHHIDHSVIMTTQGARQNWRPQSMDALCEDDLHLLASHALDLIILGTGATQHLLSRALKETMGHLAVPYEVMSSAAAVRTFNMMLIDQRPATLALLIR